jgi:hypothetical protein
MRAGRHWGRSADPTSQDETLHGRLVGEDGGPGGQDTQDPDEPSDIWRGVGYVPCRC